MAAQKRSRWLQFNLRSMFVMMTVLCIWPGTYIAYEQRKARREHAAADAFRRAGAQVCSYSGERSDVLRLLLGNDKYARASLVQLLEDDAQITDETLVHLGQLPTIDHLWLKTMPVTDAGMAHVGKLQRLNRLHLDETRISDAGLAHLTELRELTWLTLVDTNVTDAGLAHLAMLPSLEWLDLNRTPITDAGLAHLAKIPNLERLDLRGALITDLGLVQLERSSSLELVYLDQTKVTPAGIRWLEKRRPGFRVIANKLLHAAEQTTSDLDQPFRTSDFGQQFGQR